MPTAGESGALLGLAYEMHANSLLNRSFCGGRCVLTMFVGAVVAKSVSRWDREAKLRKQADDKEREMRLYTGSGSWY